MRSQRSLALLLRVLGIDGIFLYSNEPAAFENWYAQNLGIELKKSSEGYFVNNYYRVENSSKRFYNVIEIMAPEGGSVLQTKRSEFMINFRVDNLEELAAKLRESGIEIGPVAIEEDAEGLGKFAHLTDSDGNRIELWQPSNQ